MKQLKRYRGTKSVIGISSAAQTLIFLHRLQLWLLNDFYNCNFFILKNLRLFWCIKIVTGLRKGISLTGFLAHWHTHTAHTNNKKTHKFSKTLKINLNKITLVCVLFYTFKSKGKFTLSSKLGCVQQTTLNQHLKENEKTNGTILFFTFFYLDFFPIFF